MHTVRGSPAFMSTENFEGYKNDADFTKYDPLAADLYSFGLILLLMKTNVKKIFKRSDIEILLSKIESK